MSIKIRESLLDKKLVVAPCNSDNCLECVGYREPFTDDSMCLEISALATRQGLVDCCTNNLVYKFEE